MSAMGMSGLDCHRKERRLPELSEMWAAIPTMIGLAAGGSFVFGRREFLRNNRVGDGDLQLKFHQTPAYSLIFGRKAV